MNGVESIAWKVMVAPAVYPVNLQQLATQLNIDAAENAVLLTELIAAATDYAETQTHRSFIHRTIQATHYPQGNSIVQSATPYDLLSLPRGPVSSIVSVTDCQGVNLPYEYRKIGNGDYLRLTNGGLLPVVITYIAGYGGKASDVPWDIRQAIRAHADHLYIYREANEEATPKSLELTYAKYRQLT